MNEEEGSINRFRPSSTSFIAFASVGTPAAQSLSGPAPSAGRAAISHVAVSPPNWGDGWTLRTDDGSSQIVEGN